jgi:lysophospholipase L1-like esterase
MEHYGWDSGVSLIPMNTNIDAKNNIKSGVHPTEVGYRQMGNSIYFWLKSFEK